MHWRGIRHKDMTKEQLYCQGAVPEWAVGAVLEHRAPQAVDPNDARAKKLEHAQAMLKRAETKLRRAQTIVERWEHRVRAADRAIVRAASTGAIAADKTPKGGPQ
jgi:hypothetical protein